MILTNIVFLSDIKRQLNEAHTICRQVGKDHPKCKAEWEILDAQMKLYQEQFQKAKRYVITKDLDNID